MSFDTEFFQFRCPTKITYGVGMAADFSAELDSLNVHRLFVITDAFLYKSGLVTPILDGLTAGGREVVGVFTDVPSDSGVRVIEKCAQEAIASEAQAIIAIGGGSVLDTSKGVNILLSLGGNLVEDYSGAQTIREPLKPLIAIPTTAGTGSEVTEAMVILDESSNTKMTFVDEHLLPTLAILDPSLTVSMPGKVTAATGMDALTHAIEAMASIQRGPMSDALALKAIALIAENLPIAVLEPDNLTARGAMLTAATIAGIAFDHAKVGVVHAVAHTLGGMFHIHHGTANSIFLPFGMEYNLEEAMGAYAQMAEALGVKGTGLSERERAVGSIAAVRALQADLEKSCGLSRTLSPFGVTKDHVAAIVDGAIADGASFQNPRELTLEDLSPLVERAI